MNRFRSKRSRFQGTNYRSVLEHCWAEFLTAAGLEYRYEVQRFRLGRLSYLPDFYLCDLRLFLEIKPLWPTVEELTLCRLLSIRLAQPILLAVGKPTVAEVLEFRGDEVGIRGLLEMLGL